MTTQRTLSMNWGRETSPRPCTPQNERNFPKIRSLLHMAPTSQNDQLQRIERKLLGQTVRINGQPLSLSRCVPGFLNSYKTHAFLPIAETVALRSRELSLPGKLRRTGRISFIKVSFTSRVF